MPPDWHRRARRPGGGALVGTIERRLDLAAVQLAFSLQLSEEGSGREQKTFELEICSVHPELRMIAGPRIAEEL